VHPQRAPTRTSEMICKDESMLPAKKKKKSPVFAYREETVKGRIVIVMVNSVKRHRGKKIKIFEEIRNEESEIWDQS